MTQSGPREIITPYRAIPLVVPEGMKQNESHRPYRLSAGLAQLGNTGRRSCAQGRAFLGGIRCGAERFYRLLSHFLFAGLDAQRADAAGYLLSGTSGKRAAVQ